MLNFVSISALGMFNQVLSARGLDPATANLSTAEKARTAAMVTRAVSKAWRMSLWPQLQVVKRIEFRQTWDALDEYESGDEVYHCSEMGIEGYWRSLVDDNTGVEPGTNAASWARCESDMLFSISYAEHGIDEMDLAGSCFFSNPERVRDPRVYMLTRTGTGAAVVTNGSLDVPARPYIKYRPFPPKYSWEAWAAGTAYAIGDVILHDGDCWCAQTSSTGTTPGTDETVWAPMPVPEMFMDFVEDWCTAQAMQDDDGKAKAEGAAERTLMETHAAFAGQIRTRRRASVRVC